MFIVYISRESVPCPTLVLPTPTMMNCDEAGMLPDSQHQSQTQTQTQSQTQTQTQTQNLYVLENNTEDMPVAWGQLFTKSITIHDHDRKFVVFENPKQFSE